MSALVTQIVRTLQRNKCIFNCSCIEGMWNPFPLRETVNGRGYGSSVSKSLGTVFFFFCVKKVKGSNDELVSPTTQPEGNHCTLIHHALIYDRQSNEGMFHVRNKNDFLLFVLLLI